ncbi:SdiA-regulated domain-containing protein [Dyadobacter sp. CY312]|uniref:SdiA-regulated domain-containing protein n=1 Tax=Dyadobacter sp. CY312 TaxID=2907303 RepID=UPI001F220784|nr:SdiA-regulated domain-containing protein [Dyadobacter sp. CY312]MCE7039367.1 SdiA-regulated domain-containing protein [Dyadobacter sp. CY312]
MIKNIQPLVTALLVAFTLTSCTPADKPKDKYTEYDLHNPDKFNMPESLFEISGITFNKGQNDTVYAVQDEDGKVFRLGWDVKVQKHTRFAKKGDFEDLTIIGDEVFILKSNGMLYSFPLAETAFEEAENVKEYKKLVSKGEYEGMYGDEKNGSIYILCKNCVADDSKKSVTGYIIDLKTPENVRTFSIDVDQIRAITGKVERGFRPSALALNPINGKWYMVSAVNKMLVIADGNWKVTDVVALSSNMFTQPEGIAFDKEGNMYISNEGDDLSEGNILKFKRTGK